MIHPKTSSYKSLLLSRYQTVPRFWVVFFLHLLCEHMPVCEFSYVLQKYFERSFACKKLTGGLMTSSTD